MTVKEHPLEIPCQMAGLIIATVGIWAGFVMQNAIAGILGFSVGAFLFVRAPHNYEAAP